ncbi:GAF and ANTAR domain-containing protein [Streptomyces sp. NPDC007205]|uniref:GAF and ANTAR domain-containing protein n=1 Tax=Streptomyces sp. NPDC007205 TaxID=3154316 RepID=UPI003405B8BC
MDRSEPAIEAFAELADALVGDFDLVETLDRIVGHCVTVCGAAGVGLVIQDAHHVLRDIAYSDDQVRRLERHQVTVDEGPCVDCVATGDIVIAHDLGAAHTRWPRFAPAALDAGFTSVRALPIRHRGRTIGALNLFDQDTGAGSEAALRAAQAFADLALLAVLQQAQPRDGIAAHITRALHDRSGIERAKGMLAHDADTSLDHAFTLLRAHAHRTGQGITTLARALAEGQTTTREVLAAAPSQ